MSQAKPIDTMNFETALNELETIVRGLEKGDISLDDSIKAYERGVALKTHCQKKLRNAQAKIEKISVGDDGSVKTELFDTPNN